MQEYIMQLYKKKTWERVPQSSWTLGRYTIPALTERILSVELGKPVDQRQCNCVFKDFRVIGAGAVSLFHPKVVHFI